MAQISAQAYAKILLHGAKYGAQAVGGLLVGAVDGSGVRVTDVLPVYHGNPVGPVFEVAWALFEQQQAAWGQQVVIVGAYYAHEEVVAGGATMPAPAFIEALLPAVREKLGDSGAPVVLELDGNLIGSAGDQLCTVLAAGNVAKTLSPLDSTVAKLNSFADVQLRAGKQQRLVDVESHMESGPTANVRNAGLLE